MGISNFIKKNTRSIQKIVKKCFGIKEQSAEECMIKYAMKIDNANYKAINKRLNEIFNQEEFPLFKTIELETQNRCNNNCSFCPVSVGNDTREHLIMRDNLFKKIINELAEINYAGSFAIFSNNEPLIDNRFAEFAKIAKSKLPSAHHYIYTNGILLTIDLFNEIHPYLDKIIIDNYNDEMKMNPNIKKIYELCIENPELQEKVCISMRLKNQVLLSRGGNAPNRENFTTLKSTCVLPFEQVIIRPDGKLSLCCNDALGQMTLGDLTQNTLMEIWNGEIYNSIRKKLLESRAGVNLCKYCDLFKTKEEVFPIITKKPKKKSQKKVSSLDFNEKELKKYYKKS